MWQKVLAASGERDALGYRCEREVGPKDVDEKIRNLMENHELESFAL